MGGDKPPAATHPPHRTMLPCSAAARPFGRADLAGHFLQLAQCEQRVVGSGAALRLVSRADVGRSAYCDVILPVIEQTADQLVVVPLLRTT